MALLGGYLVADGNAVALSTVVPSTVKQVDIKANAANGASVFIGGSDVAADGSNAWIELEAGDPYGLRAPEGEQINLNGDDVYIVGTASDKIHISYVL
jgi:hypothetical protein